MRSFDIMKALTDMDDDVLLRVEEDHPKRRRVLPRTFRRIIAACLPVVLILTAWFVTDAVSVDTTLKWTVRYRENEVTYLFKVEASLGGELPNYEPTWLPEGYVFNQKLWDTSEYQTLTYRNTDDDLGYLSLTYELITNRTKYRLTYLQEGSYEKQTVEINGMPGELYLFGDNLARGTLIWIDEENCIVFSLGFENDSSVDILRIAESVAVTD